METTNLGKEPYSHDTLVHIERCLLGLALFDDPAKQRTIQSVLEHLTPTDFRYHPHRFIFEAIRYLRAKGEGVDLITVSARLEELGLLAVIGGRGYLMDSMEVYGSWAYVTEYTTIIRNAAIARSLRNLCIATESDLHYGHATVDQAAERHQSELRRILQRKESCGPKHISSALEKALAEEEARLTAPEGVTGWRTGFDQLDQLTGGLKPGSLWVLAAKTHVGKSSLALSIAAEVSKQTTVIVYSLEMNECSIGQRLLKMGALGEPERIEGGLFRNRQPTPEEELENFKRVALEYGNRPLWLDDKAGVTVSHITVKSQAAQLASGCGLIVVDYLQIMGLENEDPRYRRVEVGKATEQLRTVGKDMECSILLLSQLRRGEDEKENKGRPQIWHLKESGDIENNSDVIMLAHRPEMRREDDEEPVDIEPARLYVEKNRQTGKRGVINMMFSSNSASFYEVKQHAYARSEK